MLDPPVLQMACYLSILSHVLALALALSPVKSRRTLWIIVKYCEKSAKSVKNHHILWKVIKFCEKSSNSVKNHQIFSGTDEFPKSRFAIVDRRGFSHISKYSPQTDMPRGARLLSKQNLLIFHCTVYKFATDPDYRNLPPQLNVLKSYPTGFIHLGSSF